MATTQQVSPDTLIAVKVLCSGIYRRCKLPMKQLTPTSLPAKVKQLLSLPEAQDIILERYSDSAAGYVTLDSANIQVYKTLMRAAKAKLKLRLRATLPPPPSAAAAPVEGPANFMDLAPGPKQPMLATKPSSATLVGAPENIEYLGSKVLLNETDTDTPMKAPTGTGPTPPSSNNSVKVSIKPPKNQQPVHPRLASAQPGQNIDLLRHLASQSVYANQLAFRVKEPPAPMPFCSWSVYCNNCDKPMSNEHYHCSVCDNGDYDLCEACVELGVHCPGEGHWLIKRFVKNGKVINSSTRTIPPKDKGKAKASIPAPAAESTKQAGIPNVELSKDMPGAFTEEKVTSNDSVEKNLGIKAADTELLPASRICNCCIDEFPDYNFVACEDCPDFDLCVTCHLENQHGHHPGHKFVPVSDNISMSAKDLCTENRGMRHAAICDGCDKTICGVRHKCLNCPDWDYCSACIKNASFIHPNHRFVPVYSRLAEPNSVKSKHLGIFCDGPLCQTRSARGNQSYIQGVRYKCAVCHDTDFCANCEASPSNRHNRTHPLIMFKTPVRNVSVTTMNEDNKAQRIATLGDRRPIPFAPRAAPVTTGPSNSSFAPVHTVADVEPRKPTLHPTVVDTPKSSRISGKDKIAIKDLLSEPVKETAQPRNVVSNGRPLPVRSTKKEDEPERKPAVDELSAQYLADSITDGTRLTPSQRFVQTWRILNPGPLAWPVGCSVRYVGGDNMFNIDNGHPFASKDIAKATESNVLQEEVPVGEEYSFSVLMKAPAREGTAISYWRLKTPDGLAFGNKLWCHIDVAREEIKQEMKKEIETETMDEVKKDIKAEDYAGVLLKSTEKAILTQASSDVLSSQMIFPTLEKESPVTSMHEAEASPATSAATRDPIVTKEDDVPATAADTKSPQSTQSTVETDLFDDAESVEIVDSDSWDEDDGVITDEEWDVLGASDEE